MTRSSALKPALSAFSLALLVGCNSDKALTTAANPTDTVAAPADSLSAKFPAFVGQIAFVSTRDGSPYIYVVAADGSSLRRLTRGSWPAWSSDGRQIVFNGVDSAGDPSIHVINADGSGERVLQARGPRPVWSPDGKRLAFVAELGIYVANRDGSNPTLLVSSDFQRPQDTIGDLAWSPDGRNIAFVSGDWDLFGFGIYVANIDGSGVYGTVLPGNSPRWSPDGSLIAFETVSFRSAREAPTPVLAVAKPDGSDMRLINTGSLLAGEPDWSPDGRSVLFVGSSESSQSRIFVTDTAFRAKRQLVPDAVAPTLRMYADYGAVWSRVVAP